MSLEEFCRLGILGDNALDCAPLLTTALKSILRIGGPTRVDSTSASWLEHCWSSAAAQHVTTDCCIAAGASSDAFLCGAYGLPTRDDMAISVATEDVILFRVLEKILSFQVLPRLRSRSSTEFRLTVVFGGSSPNMLTALLTVSRLYCSD